MEALRAFARNSRIRGSGCFYYLLAALPLALVSFTWAQQQQNMPPRQSDVASRQTGPVVSLQELVGEAERNNPEIAVAQRGYQAATHVAGEVSAFPETHLMLQHFSVGSPRPFAGYTNSNFAYVGIGASRKNTVIRASAAYVARWQATKRRRGRSRSTLYASGSSQS